MAERQRMRIVIENVHPSVDCGRFPAKRIIGDRVIVTADIFVDGHDAIAAGLLYRAPGDLEWKRAPMKHTVNDNWSAEFGVYEQGVHHFTVEAWVDHFKTWQSGLGKKLRAHQDISMDILIGADIVARAAEKTEGENKSRMEELANYLRNATNSNSAAARALAPESTQLMEQSGDTEFAERYDPELRIEVDRPKARFSTWYECFPRSTSPEPGRAGTFRDLEKRLPEIARMGFDVLYLPPIHPIGRTDRKGKNNNPVATPGDPGSPWAIGAEEGGHKSIHPKLGSMEDFERLIKKTTEHGMEIALDLAFQCSPDHPYVREHPEWFKIRPDGSVQFAENPPKKYQDIFPLNFETEAWRSLWEELKSVVLFWIEKGVRIFRVDNPHTKPFSFWQWLIGEIKRDYPEVLFLSEAFTRPKVMKRLAKVGFTQSYTYFTWRNSKAEIMEYLRELTQTGVREYFRPNFWPNTPDILSEYLQYSGRPAFVIKLILAATLSSNYGIYGPPFELLESEALPGREEYMNSEKYEVRHWDWDRPGNLKDFIARLNRIRKENGALQQTDNLRFYEVDNDQLLFFGKTGSDSMDSILVVVNLDPVHTQSGYIRIPLRELGIEPGQPFLGHDLLSDEKYIWYGERNFIKLNPHVVPAHIFKLRKRIRRETDFDYFL